MKASSHSSKAVHFLRASIVLAILGSALTVTPARAAGPTVVWDESRFVTLSSNNITGIAMANDFLLRGARSLSGFTAWLSDDVMDDDGVLDSFSGTLGWAIYSNNAGQPGTLLASGQDTAPTLTDTGVQDASGCDIVRVDVGFPSAVVLPAGRYWLALHEGNWGSPSDGSIVWWQYANQVDFNQMYFSGSWHPTGAATDNAFVIRGTSVWDQSAFVTLSSNNITGIAMANDFLLPAPGSLNGFTVWLNDDVIDDDGVLDSFSGTLGWAIYSNNAGQPGTLLASGQDTAPTLTDTGVQDASGCDVVRVDVGFPSAVSLPAGRYWLALHEGNWGSPSDGSIVWWQYANQVGFNQMYFSGSWHPTGAVTDNAFVIWEDFSNRSISKSDGAAAATPGSTVTYTITVSNAGPVTEPSATVVDNFPSALTSCSTNSTAAGGASGNDPGPAAGNINDSGLVLPVGSTVTYTSVCNIDPAATGMLANTATISGANADLSPGNDTATDSDTLTPSADVSITKTDGASAEVPGTDVTYTIVASNATGPSLATGVTVSDTFPAALNACTWSSTAAGGATGNAGTGSGNINDTGIVLPVGANVTYTVNCDIDPSATGSLANTATITSAAADPVPGNNSATDTDTLDPSADISITKTDGSASAVLGTTVTYTIVASNAGPSTPTDVTVSDNFPATLTGCSTTSVANGGATGNDPGPILGTLSDGSITLPPGADVTYTASCTVDPGATGTIDNTATITSAMTDPDPGNNSATDTDTIQWIDLAITKSGGGAHVPLGGTASYTLAYSNNGLQGATGVTLTDTVPAYTTFNAAGSTAGWACLPDNNAGSTCTLNVGAVAGSGSGLATFAVTVTSPLPPGTTQLANTASIADDGTNGIDPVPGNNSSTDTTVTFDNSPPTVAAHSLQSSYIAIAPDVFTVTFSEAVSNAGGGAGVDDAANPGNYLIVEAGDDDAFQTLNCLSGVTGDDVRISASSVDYDPGTFTATVNLVNELPVGEYRLFICGTTSVVDLAGNALAGNGTTSGTDYSFDFVVIPFHPKTGFAPNRVTSLPPQPADLAYASLGDIWLEIPRLGVKASIVGVPQSSEGWEVKWLGKGVGWLNGTAFPTWQGNSVLTAHAYDAEGLPGPFVDLPKLQYGDQVIIHMNGQQYIFEVRATRLVKANNTTFAFEHLEGYPYLTLITCQNYDPQTNSYRSRRVVRAVLVEVKSE